MFKKLQTMLKGRPRRTKHQARAELSHRRRNTPQPIQKEIMEAARNKRLRKMNRIGGWYNG